MQEEISLCGSSFKMLGDIVYTASQILLAVSCFILNLILALLYWGKGKIVPTSRNPLLMKSATKLAQEIREGKLKSEDVVVAYIDRILEVQPFINATVDRFFKDAMEQARTVDALVASGKYTQEQLANEKPLLGVPFTVKVIFHVKGLPCTGACKLFEHQVATEDAAVISLMKGAGAILIATTNSAEMTLGIETVNKMYGRTCNPYDTNRTPGGSSGGESALIAAAGSLIGIGNDFLGSVRIPAHFTGIFAHKPTTGLIPTTGSFPPEYPDKPPNPVLTHLYKYVSSGPLCRYAEDLITLMKILSSESELKVDFNKKIDFKKLKICYLSNVRSPFVAPVDKSIEASLKQAVTFFEKKCGTVAKEIKMTSLFDVNRCFATRLFPMIKELKSEMFSITNFKEKEEYVKFLLGKSRFMFITLIGLLATSSSLLDRQDKSAYYAKMQKELAEEFNNIFDEDTILLIPTAPSTAPYHYGTPPLMLSISYTGFFNIFGMPATHCPMGFNKQKLPYGIQIASCKGNDALTIACAVELEKEFGGWKPPGKV